MRTLKIVAITILALGFLAAAALFAIGYFKPKPGGILVSSQPVSDVYIDGKLVGKTPYEGTFEPKIIDIELVVGATDKNYAPYSTGVALVPGVKTVVRREFGETEEASSGDIVSFEKEGGGNASLVVVTNPDNSQVSIDTTPKGFSPYKSSNISVGEHQITIKSPGFADRTLNVNLIAGYKLTIFAKLAETGKEEKVEAAVVEIKTFVEILETPTGFLRVRSEPGSAGREIHQVAPGEKYLFLEEDEASGWYKIELEAPTAGLPEGRSGWVSNEYSQKIEEEVTETPE